MKHIAIFFAFASFGSTGYAAVDCAPGLKSAYSHTIERFRVGEVTLTDVALAENAYKMKLVSCTPANDFETRIIFCQESRNAARTALEGMISESKVGARTQIDVAMAKQLVADTDRTCSKRP